MRFRRGFWRYARAALALFVTFSVLVSVVLAGHRYFFCPQMNEASLDACCAPAAAAPHESAPSNDDGPAIDREACCATAHFATPAPTTFAAAELAPRAPLVAVLSVPSPTSFTQPLAPPPAARYARAGPSEPDPRAHRLRVMVFLT
jgi:hypothetical protein